MSKTQFVKSRAHFIIICCTLRLSVIVAWGMIAWKLLLGAPYDLLWCAIVFPAGILLYFIIVTCAYPFLAPDEQAA